MGRYTKIPQSTFQDMQLDAGIILKQFSLTDAIAGQAGFVDADIVTATTGGIEISCEPEYSDLGEDVDNCPVNMKELKHLDSWTCRMSFTALKISEEGFKLALGAADIDSTNHVVKPRRDLSQSDFTDLWWVGDRADGGLVAVKILNALSTGGMSIKTEKSSKGNLDVELTGHVSLTAQDVMPMEFYSIDPVSGTTGATGTT